MPEPTILGAAIQTVRRAMPGAIRLFLAAFVLVAALLPVAAAPLSLTVLKAEAATDAVLGAPIVNIELDPESTRAFAAFTTENVGKSAELRVDGEVLSAPFIREPILGGKLQISGSMTIEDAERIAMRLREGATIEVEAVE
jgi:preprotein translocase subunit SecD